MRPGSRGQLRLHQGKDASGEGNLKTPELSAADERMAAAYRAALAATPPQMKAAVRGDQRDWVGRLPLDCPAGQVHFDLDMGGCLRKEYDLRTKELRKLVLRRGGVTFFWRSILLMTLEEPASDKSEQEAGNRIERIPGYGTLSVSWPQTNADTAAWSAWNKAIVAEARRLASQDHPAPDGKWHSEWADDDDGELNVTIDVVNEQMVTAFVNRWGFRGAHPWEISMNLNWLLKEKRQLLPNDVFLPNSSWDQAIVEHCLKGLDSSSATLRK